MNFVSYKDNKYLPYCNLQSTAIDHFSYSQSYITPIAIALFSISSFLPTFFHSPIFQERVFYLLVYIFFLYSHSITHTHREYKFKVKYYIIQYVFLVHPDPTISLLASAYNHFMLIILFYSTVITLVLYSSPIPTLYPYLYTHLFVCQFS